MSENTQIDHVLELTKDKLGDLDNGHVFIPRADIEKNMQNIGLGGESKAWVNRLLNLDTTRTREQENGIILRDFHLDRNPLSKNYTCEIGFEMGSTEAEFTLSRNGTIEADLMRLDTKAKEEHVRPVVYGEVENLGNEWEDLPVGERNKIVKALLNEFWNPDQ